MKTFSQRKGLTPISEIIQKDSMTNELRNLLWNVIGRELYELNSKVSKDFALEFHTKYLKRTFDTLHGFMAELGHISKDDDGYDHHNYNGYIREFFFECEWNRVYDLIEFIINYFSKGRFIFDFDLDKIIPDINSILEQELSAYRIIDNILTDITDEQEIKMLEEALSANDKFSGVKIHLRTAFKLYSDRENPDYRNSIKESISAVESICKIICDDKGATTLSKALQTLEKQNIMHSQLRQGFLNLYNYTSDAEGIRHALLDDSNLNSSDAKYFLLSCTSFINYLKTKIS
ncbi:MAG: hypothetical protein RLZZ210_934 [Pseudomonadota bacterium]|jgi:hypothetical protein